MGLSVYDYACFAIAIAVTLILPLYMNRKGPEKKTKADYVFASRNNISIGAMLMSLARGVLGVRSFLGYPAELYYNGTSMYEIIYGMMLAYPIASYFFVPVYYNLEITSVYQYLSLRFNSPLVRYLASAFYILRNILNTGVTVFTPCIALKTVLGFPYWTSITGIMTISMICAVLGGLKAVILTDVIQGIISIACIWMIIGKGTLDAGGIGQVFKINHDGGRLNFFNFDMDPGKRITTVSAVIGQLFMSVSIFGCQQNFVQRYCSMKSLKTVQTTLWINLPIVSILFTLFWTAGGVIYANYVNCDPLTLGSISEMDEIVPFYVSHAFRDFPGVFGVFMAAIFNGALSLTVSNLNSMGTVAWEDFLCRIPRFKHFKDHQQLSAIKLSVLAIGIIIIGVAFGISLLPGLIESSQLVTSATSGPLLGVFLLAMFFPSSNSRGAACGMIVGLATTVFLMAGRLFTDKEFITFLPLSISGCNNNTFGESIEFNTSYDEGVYKYKFVDQIVPPIAASSPLNHFWNQLFGITYMYYAVIGTGFCVILGLIVSWLTGNGENDVYDENLIHPTALKISKLCPGKPRKYLKGTIQSR